MAYYRTCPHCGVHLDPGERCDCREDQAGENSQAPGDLQQKGLSGATNTEQANGPEQSEN